MIELRGITWDHPRGLAPLVATAHVLQLADPSLSIRWEARSLHAFGAQPLSALAGEFDLLVLDHPFVGTVALEQSLLPLETVLPAPFLTEQATEQRWTEPCELPIWWTPVGVGHRCGDTGERVPPRPPGSTGLFPTVFLAGGVAVRTDVPNAFGPSPDTGERHLLFLDALRGQGRDTHGSKRPRRFPPTGQRRPPLADRPVARRASGVAAT